MMTMGTRTEKENMSTGDTTISIRDENQQYTEAFVNLLRDYYLYL